MSIAERLQKITASVARQIDLTPHTEVEEMTWEQKFAKGLKEIAIERGLNSSVRWKNNKQEKKRGLVCTFGTSSVFLTQEITGGIVGEENERKFSYLVAQKDYDKYDWLREAFERNPIELYGVNESGERKLIQLENAA